MSHCVLPSPTQSYNIHRLARVPERLRFSMSRLVAGDWTGIRKVSQATWEVWQAQSAPTPAAPARTACVRLACTLPTDEAFETAFRRRIGTLKKLRHDRILAVLDGGVLDGRVWYASDWSPAPTLADHVRAGDRKSVV